MNLIELNFSEDEDEDDEEGSSYEITPTIEDKEFLNYGNFNVYVYIPVQMTSRLLKLQEKCCNCLKLLIQNFNNSPLSFFKNSTFEASPSNSNLIDLHTSPHISLCEPSFLRFHFISFFLQKLKLTFSLFPKLKVNINSSIDIFANKTFERFFAVVRISCFGQSYNILNDMIDETNKLLKEFGLPIYYSNRQIHISLASTKQNLRPLLNSLYNNLNPLNFKDQCDRHIWPNVDNLIIHKEFIHKNFEYSNLLSLNHLEILVGKKVSKLEFSTHNTEFSDTESDFSNS